MKRPAGHTVHGTGHYNTDGILLLKQCGTNIFLIAFIGIPGCLYQWISTVWMIKDIRIRALITIPFPSMIHWKCRMKEQARKQRRVNDKYERELQDIQDNNWGSSLPGGRWSLIMI